MLVFAQEQMAVFAQGLRRRFLLDTFLTGFSRRGAGSLRICGVPGLAGVRALAILHAGIAERTNQQGVAP